MTTMTGQQRPVLLELECLEGTEWPSDNNWAKLLSQPLPSVLPLAKRKIRAGKIQRRGRRDGMRLFKPGKCFSLKQT